MYLDALAHGRTDPVRSGAHLATATRGRSNDRPQGFCQQPVSARNPAKNNRNSAMQESEDDPKAGADDPAAHVERDAERDETEDGADSGPRPPLSFTPNRRA
ncbi:MAG TPA: hypothetical protein PKC26_09450 [Plasticicumulans sp.]|nr:hypothetical protein [Plasticicumulans sp.]